jgi:hypothetical protein
MSRPQRRGPPRAELDPWDRMALEIGPPPRRLHGPDWPAERARLQVLWALHKPQLLRDPGQRPWAFWQFDAPPAARHPGPVQDRLIADGAMTELDAALLASTNPDRRTPDV